MDSIDIYSYAYGNAANDHRCAMGPFIARLNLESEKNSRYVFYPPLQVDNTAYQKNALSDVTHLTTKLAEHTRQSVLKHRLFITLGGDHTAAIGSFSGASEALGNNMGLIWFDAHMDSHTFETTPSNNIHGMPLAILLGHGESHLAHILSVQPKVRPENLVLIGTRSYEADEAALLKRLGVKIFTMDDIETLGLRDVINQSIEIVTRNTDGFGISIDLDGFDPKDAPAVSVPEKNGILVEDFLTYFPLITHHPKLIGADIVEFNPEKDINQKTEKLIAHLVHQLAQVDELVLPNDDI